MTDAAVLGPLSALYEMQDRLLDRVPPADTLYQFHPELGSLAWYLGHSVYLETYWLRERLTGDADLTRRVAHLFTPGVLPLAEQCAGLPSLDHLRNWAATIRDEHLLRLANRGLLPDHPWLAQDRLVWLLLQEQARDYEQMLMVLNQRQLHCHPDYRVERPLVARPPREDAATLIQGHYRVGARADPTAYDNELPPQAVALSGFRIARHPVSNAELLAFMDAGGYQERRWWSDPGWAWRQDCAAWHPEYWRQDPAGRWYGVGVNGPADLPPAEPVLGVSQHEALAFAAWAASLDDALAGAVLQHEYQWEVAARTGRIREHGRVREWCSNPCHPYPDYAPFPDGGLTGTPLAEGRISRRGASLHTQPPLRRLSYRDCAAPGERCAFTGLRLVLPPLR